MAPTPAPAPAFASTFSPTIVPTLSGDCLMFVQLLLSPSNDQYIDGDPIEPHLSRWHNIGSCQAADRVYYWTTIWEGFPRMGILAVSCHLNKDADACHDAR